MPAGSLCLCTLLTLQLCPWKWSVQPEESESLMPSGLRENDWLRDYNWPGSWWDQTRPRPRDHSVFPSASCSACWDSALAPLLLTRPSPWCSQVQIHKPGISPDASRGGERKMPFLEPCSRPSRVTDSARSGEEPVLSPRTAARSWGSCVGRCVFP